jgi:RHS repeat-associated protein
LNRFRTGRRLFRITQPSGTIVRSEFDPRGLPIKKYVGTDDSEGGGFLPNNMQLIWVGTYDGDGGGGDGGGGTGEGDVSSSDCVVVVAELGPGTPNRIFRDARGRNVVVSRKLSPHVFYERDNLGRVTAVGLYDNIDELITPDQQGRYPYEDSAYTPRTFNGQNSHRLALAEFFYDEQGRQFKKVRHNIGQVAGQDLGQDLDSLTSLTWYDAVGRIVKQRGERLVKYRYDRLGRATHEFELAKDDDASYADVLNVTGDVVMAENQSAYEATTGNVLMSVAISRYHADDYRRGGSMTTGPLDLNQDGGTPSLMKLTAADLKGRAQIEARWYDALDRVITVARYGTNGGSTFDRTGLSEPTASSGSALVTKYSYDTAGSLLDLRDAMGRYTRYTYDHAGRTIKSVENYVDGSPGPNDEDRTTEYVYTNTLLTQQIARVPGGTDQVTTYTYGTNTLGFDPSEVATGHLLSKVEYPDKADATDVVTMLYNRQGRVKQMTDQAGNVIAFEYDEAFRIAERYVATYATDFDSSVKSILTSYNALGQLQTVTQKDASYAVLNQVKFLYDGWGNVLKTQQDHDSAIGGTHLYEVAFAYAKAAAAGTRQTVRRTGITLPDGTPVGFDYLVGGGSPEAASIVNDQFSRVRRVTVGSTPTPVAKYEYLGEGQLVGVEYPQPGIVSERFNATLGQYPGLDAFDRPIADTWASKVGASEIWHEKITYDYNSNVDRIVDEVLSGHDVDFTMDGLDRLTKAEEGTWSGSAIINRTRQEIWTLTQTGNWANHKLDRNGNNVFTDSGDLDETGTFNAANEVTQRDLWSNGQQIKTPTHDRVGNMTDDGEAFKYIYDPFGRLTKVVKRTNPSLVVAQYTYDGLGQLIAARSDTNGNGSLTDEPTERYVYDARWRIVAVYITNSAGTSTVIKERYVRHNAGLDGLGGASYIDDIILRDRDVTGPPTLEERVYYCQNAHHDVSALVDAGGTVLERVKYWSYGMPRAYPRIDADWDGDGKVTKDDLDAYTAAWENADPKCDLNGDGDVNEKDLALFEEAWKNGWTVTDGLSIVTGNRFGYTGHLWDKYTRKYHARHRVYDAARGRFLNRDPMEYAAGSVNLYEYVLGLPTGLVDPFGLHPYDGLSPGDRWVPGIGLVPRGMTPPPPPPPAKPTPGIIDTIVRCIGPDCVLNCTGGPQHIPGIDEGPTQDVIVLCCDVVSIAAPCGATLRVVTCGGKALRAMKETSVIVKTTRIDRIRKWIRWDRPHHGKPAQWDGIIPKKIRDWFFGVE